MNKRKLAIQTVVMEKNSICHFFVFELNNLKSYAEVRKKMLSYLPPSTVKQQ